LLTVQFDDIETSEQHYVDHGLIIPEATHISEILDWAKQKWEENGKPFVVHCTSGVSRSAAVAMLINQMILNNYRAGWDIDLHSPNQMVMEHGEDHLGVDSFRETVKQETKKYDQAKWDAEDNYNPF
jgi:rhodanese-related sulfurtransferase